MRTNRIILYLLGFLENTDLVQMDLELLGSYHFFTKKQIREIVRLVLVWTNFCINTYCYKIWIFVEYCVHSLIWIHAYNMKYCAVKVKWCMFISVLQYRFPSPTNIKHNSKSACFYISALFSTFRQECFQPYYSIGNWNS